MNVSADALPTVVWKWPGTHDVLCITAFMPNDALMAPPQPPMREQQHRQDHAARPADRPRAAARIQPNSPVPPRARPAISSDAMIVKAVTKLGYRINSVLNV